MGNTTIEITDEQKDELDNRKRVDGESYKSVLGRLLDSTVREAEPGSEPKQDYDELIEEIKNAVSMGSDPTVDVDVDRIMSRLDELERQIPERAADETVRKLR